MRTVKLALARQKESAILFKNILKMKRSGANDTVVVLFPKVIGLKVPTVYETPSHSHLPARANGTVLTSQTRTPWAIL